VIALQKTESESDASPTKRLTAEQRRTDIRRVATDLFDFGRDLPPLHVALLATARRPSRPNSHRLFTDLLERAYIGRIESYSGEKILYGTRDRRRLDFATRPPPRSSPAATPRPPLEYPRQDGRWGVRLLDRSWLRVNRVKQDGPSGISALKDSARRPVGGHEATRSAMSYILAPGARYSSGVSVLRRVRTLRAHGWRTSRAVSVPYDGDHSRSE